MAALKKLGAALERLWAGFVAALAGAGVGLGVVIAARIMIGLKDSLTMPTIVAFAAIGFILGVAIGNRKIGGGKHDAPE